MESVFWSDGVAGLHPYVPGEQPQIANLVKLNTNENPFPPSEQVLAAIAAAAPLWAAAAMAAKTCSAGGTGFSLVLSFTKLAICGCSPGT